MPKISLSRKKGIQRSIPTHRIASKERNCGRDHDNPETDAAGYFGVRQSKYSSVGKKCFQILMASCEKLHLVGFTRTPRGEYVPLGRTARIWHYVTVSICLALWMQKMWATAQVLVREEMGMEFFVCLSVAFVPTVAVIVGLPVVLRPKETMDLLNSWFYFSESLKSVDPHAECHPLDNWSACLKTASCTLDGQIIAIGVAAASLTMGNLGICYFPFAKNLGLIPEGILPNWAWQIMFAPLEWLTALPFMLMSPVSVNFFFMAVGALDVYLRQLRRINVRYIKDRRRLEQMYVQLELFHRIAQVWIRLYFPPWLFATAATVIIATFVAIRYTEIPLLIYLTFPCTACTMMLLIFWQSYDLLGVVRGSEDILAKLAHYQAPYFRAMTRAKRVELMKRSKAMRPLGFYIADSEFSLGLPINTWDEILNQILFLLSL